MKTRKICVVTGSRAEYGLLSGFMKAICRDKSLRLQIIVTGSHLSSAFGLTYRDIERDGFRIQRKIPISGGDVSAEGVTKTVGLAVIGFADALKSLRPDWLAVLGDRYEILSAVIAALIAKIPVVHFAGGDITEGAYDDAMRHAITKMSHVHFATHAAAACRIRQMGEDPRFIFNLGHLGLDGIQNVPFLSSSDLEEFLKFKLRKKNLLITFHPATLETPAPIKQLYELFGALECLGPDVGLIFTGSNMDTGGGELNQHIKKFVAAHANACFKVSMGRRAYLSALRYVHVAVGNSSSGVYEVPSFRKPTVNIGDRQKGREQAASIINCPPQKKQIYKAILRAFRMNCTRVVNPYQGNQSVLRALRILKKIRDPQKLLKKRFRML